MTNSTKVKNSYENNKSKNPFLNIKIIDIEPDTMYLPDKYYTAKVNDDEISRYLNKDDIVIIDPASKQVKESGLYLFEFRGHILIRQFQLMPCGVTKRIKDHHFMQLEQKIKMNIL